MDAVTLDRTVEIPEHVASERLDDEVAIVTLHSNMYFGLNAVGARLRALLAAGGTLRERDVLRGVEALRANALLSRR